jgi:hypothetical protein
MKEIYLEEEGVASAVGTIFAILIFVSILSIFVTTYVPATMMSDEEQYSSNLMNSMIQLASAINEMTMNYKQGETSLISFDLESSYVPIFSSPTMGSSSTPFASIGGSVMSISNNRYFVDEVWTYEFSSMMYNVHDSKTGGNSTLLFNLLQIGPSTNQYVVNLSFNLVNIVGGPFTISTASPFALTAEILSKQVLEKNGTGLTMSLTSNYLGQTVKESIYSTLGLLIQNHQLDAPIYSSSGNVETISIKANSNYSMNIMVTEVTIFVGYSTLIQ